MNDRFKEDGLGAIYLISKIKRVFALRSQVYTEKYKLRWYHVYNVLCGRFYFLLRRGKIWKTEESIILQQL